MSLIDGWRMSVLSKQKFDFLETELNSQEQIIFYKNWLKLKGSKSLPIRSDFDPMDIPKALPYVIMANVIGEPKKIKLRLIGSKCNVPASYNGKYLDEFSVLKPLIDMNLKMIDNKKTIYIFKQY